MRHGFTLIAGCLVMGLAAWLFGSQSGHAVLELRKAGLSDLEATTSESERVPSADELATQAAAAPDALRVLFVGNSHTFVNNMPAMIAALAHVGGQRPLYAQLIARGGARIQEHVSEGHASAALSAGGWNALVLQEQQQGPSLARERRELELNAPARILSMNAQAIGARTIVQMVWARRDGDQGSVPGDTFAAMHERSVLGHRELARDLGAELAPTAIAWKRATEARPELALWQPDGMHPSLAGSYLAACVLYRVLYRANPSGLRFTAGLPEPDAAFLQDIAATTE